MFDLTGKVAIVTGGSRGIGRSACENLAKAGAKVVVTSRKLDACEEVANKICDDGGEAIAIASSLGKQDQLKAMVDQTVDTWGKVDILICNAAINPYYGPLADLSNEIFDKMMHSNVRDNLFLCKQVLPGMAERKDGCIQIVSSVGGIRGNSVLGAYGMTKAADMALVRNLAVEWGKKNIRVNCIAPGLIKTDFARALWENPEMRKHLENMTPIGRIGEPDDIGLLITFLATNGGDFITGETIIADGGMSISQGA